MKKLTAYVLAVLLLLSLTACGTDPDAPAQDSTTTTTTATTTTTTQAEVDGTTTVGSDNNTTTASGVPTTSATTPSSTTTAPTTAPSGDIIPIGTKPTATTTTTTTKAPTTTKPVDEPMDGTTTTVTTTTTTTTTTTVKPTVTKKKDRIRVSGYEVWYNEDGTIHVEMTFRNVSSNWITEETDYLVYACYDANGNVVQKNVKLALGIIDTKKYYVRTYSVDLPANTAELRFTKSQITYWTEWA